MGVLGEMRGLKGSRGPSNKDFSSVYKGLLQII